MSVEREDTKPATPELQDQLVQTRHTVTINGEQIAYTATTGTLVLKEEREKAGEQAGISEGERPRATLFFVAYTRDDVPDVGRRPITFAFNGGPGSSSVWLHLGLLGPRRVQMNAEGWPLPPPYRLVENEHALLDTTDLVFIDPVSTGYSRVIEGEKAKAFYGFKRDVEAVGDFIRLYVTRYQRWLSPKLLAGESYGTTRAAALSGYLQERHGMYLNGIILISSVLNFQTLSFEHNNELPYVLFLPSYAATAWYHQRLGPDVPRNLPALLREVEQFALGTYAPALLRGSGLPAEERAEIARALARYTGLGPEYIERANLRIPAHRFFKELLRDQARTVGRLDSRFTGRDRDAAGEAAEFDPSLAAISGPYTAALNHYVRAELQFESDLPYEVLNFKVNQDWSYAEHENRYLDVVETLRKAINVNPALRVFVGSGYYDLATPYFAADYDLAHLSLDGVLQQHVTVGYYEAGHMMYIHLPSLARLRADLVAFIGWACAGGA